MNNFVRVILLLTLSLISFNVAFAQFTILPDASQVTDEACKSAINAYEFGSEGFPSDAQKRNELLGCAIRTGNISFSMMPYYVTYIANFMLSLGGIIAVLLIVVGGYNYIYGGLTDQKEKGKKTIMNALIGMMIAILSWVIVQVVLSAVTG